jgi:hypothetical protein
VSLQALLLTKSIAQLQSELGRAGQFRRVLGLWQLTAIGLGGLIGAGVLGARDRPYARQSHSDACQTFAR